jgi:hypothetical protein
LKQLTTLKIDCNPKSQKLSEVGQQAFTIRKFFHEVHLQDATKSNPKPTISGGVFGQAIANFPYF